MAWLGSGGRQDIVLKQYSGPARNPLFPNDPQAEARLLDVLAINPIAPKRLASFETAEGTCNVYAHIPGETWVAGAADVARLMKRLHDTPAPLGLRVVADGRAQLVEQTREILAQCRDCADLTQVPRGQSVAPSCDLSLLHGDIVPGNLIRNKSGLHLIDWQCPAMGDPCEDIAIFLSPAMQQLYRGSPLTHHEIDEFWGAYDNTIVRRRYESLASLYHWRMASYCQWQIENGRPDYVAARALELTNLYRSDSTYPR